MSDYKQPTATTDQSLDSIDKIRMIHVGELSSILGVSTRTVWRLLSGGQLPQPVRFGRNVRWNYADVRAWIESHRDRNASTASKPR